MRPMRTTPVLEFWKEVSSPPFLSLSNNDKGLNSILFGYEAGFNLEAASSANSAFGYRALSFNTTGNANTAVGFSALYFNTTGSDNTANGKGALQSNSKGEGNTANGSQALVLNTEGSFNTANGRLALYQNNTGDFNTAGGYKVLYSNTTGSFNSANGYAALYSNTTGMHNTATGNQALYSNQTGSFNAANGYAALYFNSTGGNNTATGNQALNENRTGSKNTAIGAFADVMSANLSNATAIGYNAKVSRSNKIRLGDANITVIEGQVPFTTTSDRRLKEDIQTTNLGLDFVNDLNPVQYHRINNEGADIELGVIAQELEAVLEKHHATDSGMIHQVDDSYLSVRYNDLFAPLIKSVQELSAQNVMLKAELAAQESQMAELKALILASNAN